MGARFDVSGVLRQSARLAAVPKKFEIARVRAISRLTRGLLAEAARDIGAEHALTRSRINKGLAISRTNEYVELVGSGDAIGIAQGYQGRQTKNGVVVTLLRNKGPERFRHAFIRVPGGRAKSTGRQAFERAGAKSPRYPIYRMFFANIASTLRDPDRANRLADFARGILAAEIERQLRLL